MSENKKTLYLHYLSSLIQTQILAVPIVAIFDNSFQVNEEGINDESINEAMDEKNTH